MRSLSPIARYFSRSWSPSRSVGGSVQTPAEWSAVSFGFALISERASSTKPAFVEKLDPDATPVDFDPANYRETGEGDGPAPV